MDVKAPVPVEQAASNHQARRHAAGRFDLSATRVWIQAWECSRPSRLQVLLTLGSREECAGGRYRLADQPCSIEDTIRASGIKVQGVLAFPKLGRVSPDLGCWGHPG